MLLDKNSLIKILTKYYNKEESILSLISIIYHIIHKDIMIPTCDELYKELTTKINPRELISIEKLLIGTDLETLLNSLISSFIISEKISYRDDMLYVFNNFIINLLELENNSSIIELNGGLSLLVNSISFEDNINYNLVINDEKLKLLTCMSLDCLIKPHNVSVYESCNLLNKDYDTGLASYINPITLNHKMSFELPAIIWDDIEKLLSKMNRDKFKAVLVLPNRLLLNTSEKNKRNSLISKNIIETIIELPYGLSNLLIDNFSVVILKNQCSKIKFYDYSKETYSKHLYDKIIDDYRNGNCISLSNNKCMSKPLLPSIVSIQNLIVKGTPLCNLATLIAGSQYTMSVFKSKNIVTNLNTGTRILTPGDIIDSNVDWRNLTCIYPSEKLLKFKLNKGDVILSAKSSIVKTVVFDSDIDEDIIATGGITIIRPIKNKLDPYYLKMFLGSNDGMLALQAIQCGVSIISYTINNLMTIQIPYLDINKQKEKANKYIKITNEIRNLRTNIKKLEKDLTKIYNS